MNYEHNFNAQISYALTIVVVSAFTIFMISKVTNIF